MTEANLFALPHGTQCRPHSRAARLCCELSIALRNDLDCAGSMEAMDRYGQQAVEMVAGPAGPAGASISRASRENVRDRYGKHLWCQQALLGPAPGRGRRRLRDPRPELSQGLRHLGHARRQHPALRRHQAGLGRCCRCSII